MRQEHGPPRGIFDEFRMFVAERRLHYEMVTKPSQSAHW
jgi:hypothetical protein